MTEIPSDQDAWLDEVDHEDVYESAGLDTNSGEDESAERLLTRALRLLKRGEK